MIPVGRGVGRGIKAIRTTSKPGSEAEDDARRLTLVDGTYTCRPFYDARGRPTQTSYPQRTLATGADLLPRSPSTTRRPHCAGRWYTIRVSSADAAPTDEEILARFGIEPDPVVEAYKRDVDRSLLRQNLRRTPAERWKVFMTMLKQADELRRAGKAARGQ